MVTELETERSLVEVNRGIAARFEKYLQDAFTRIWEDKA
jgi:hypothetical protein